MNFGEFSLVQEASLRHKSEGRWGQGAFRHHNEDRSEFQALAAALSSDHLVKIFDHAVVSDHHDDFFETG
ncbi:hypothetical protein LWI29_034495 [Acer saccharum]|uniref:Uncharacterized protein n=1 Tax=Acer saccharum TaxID=4024 RepID=A0AA39UY47_ACESA|nr:hypothetical protein LWI29_034495 [Acer saccharum]